MPPSKRKRSGPGLSFAQGGTADRSASRPATKRSAKGGYNPAHRLPSKTISGPGIFVTCAKGKERKTALQLIDHLNEIADHVYRGVKLLPPLKRDEKKPDGQDESVDEEELMDRMRNGPASNSAEAVSDQQTEASAAEGQPAPPPAESEAAAERTTSTEDDIEAQIHAELAELRGQGSAPSKRAKTDPANGGSSKNGKGKDRQRDTLEDGTPTQRFRKVETDTECLIFISCARPIDPYKMVYEVLEEVERTGEPRSRFVQRLSPITDTCSANADQVALLAQRVIPTFFPVDGPGKTFKIDPRIRSHNLLTRGALIQLVASAIPGEAGHHADLQSPDHWIIVEVHKNVCAIGVVRDYERFKKLNVQSVAEAANAARGMRGEGGDREGRVAGSLARGAVGGGPVRREEVATVEEGQRLFQDEKPATTEEAQPAEEDEGKTVAITSAAKLDPLPPNTDSSQLPTTETHAVAHQ